MTMTIEVEAVSADDTVKVVLEDIGEGIDGDYNASDPHDVPLLRFTVMRQVKDAHEPAEDEGYEWTELDDASYCTQIPATTPRAEVARLARLLLAEVEGPAREHGKVKKLCERLSWINPTWGTPGERRGYTL